MCMSRWKGVMAGSPLLVFSAGWGLSWKMTLTPRPRMAPLITGPLRNMTQWRLKFGRHAEVRHHPQGGGGHHGRSGRQVDETFETQGVFQHSVTSLWSSSA